MVEELYESFTGLYTKEIIRKCLEVNDFDIESTAEFMINFVSEDLDNALLSSKEGTKPINKQVILNYKCSEQKEIIDISNFFNYTWLYINRNLQCYSYIEGTCYLFGTDSKSMKKIVFEEAKIGEEKKKVDDVINEKNSILEKLTTMEKTSEADKTKIEEYTLQLAALRQTIMVSKVEQISEKSAETTFIKAEYDIISQTELKTSCTCYDPFNQLFITVFDDMSKFLSQNVVIHDPLTKRNKQFEREVKCETTDLKITSVQSFFLSLIRQISLINTKGLSLPYYYKQDFKYFTGFKAGHLALKTFLLHQEEWSGLKKFNPTEIEEELNIKAKLLEEKSEIELFKSLTGQTNLEECTKPESKKKKQT